MRCEGCGIRAQERPLFRANVEGVMGPWYCTPCGGARDPDPPRDLIRSPSLIENARHERNVVSIEHALRRMQGMIAVGHEGPNGEDVEDALRALDRLRKLLGTHVERLRALNDDDEVDQAAVIRGTPWCHGCDLPRTVCACPTKTEATS